MEENLNLISPLDIVINNKGGVSVFEIKEPKRFQRNLLNDLKKEYSIVEKGNIVVYPEQRIIDSQNVFIETSSVII
jgi:hypothetical protein